MRTLLPFIIAIALLSSGCHESLPLRADPGDVFSGHLDAHYVIDDREHDVWLCMTLTNEYEETLQAKLQVTGEAVIMLASDTSVHRRIPLTVDSVRSGPFNRDSKILTIDKGGSVLVTAIWDFRDDDGRDVRDRFTFERDPLCDLRLISTQTFLIRARIKLIDHTHEVRFPDLLFTRTLADRVVSTKLCNGASFESPCY